MKGAFEKTKVVVRRLPPGISQEALMEQINGRFAGRYKWVCFRPGKNSQKNQRYARAYVDFNNPEDVVEFAEFFDGHTFVNEKGTQFKAVVEFAPSQRVPKVLKKDGREGTIYKDPEYLEFLELLAKPVENLPSAEIQLEKREAERVGVKDVPIVTPLMDFVRQKRAAKTDARRSLCNGKLGRRTVVVSGGGSSSAQKRGAEKRKVHRSMYVLRDGAKNSNRKERSSFVVISRRDDQCLSEKVGQITASGVKALESGTETGKNGTVSGVSGSNEGGKQIVLLLKGKEKEPVASSGSTLCGSSAFKQSLHHESGGVVIRSILSKDARQSEQNIQTPHLEKDKHPPRPTLPRLASRDRIAGIIDGDKRSVDDKLTGNGMQGSSSSEKQDKRTRNKDRPDRGVWAPLRRSDYSHAGDDTSSSINAQVSLESSESTYKPRKGNNKVGDSSRVQNVQSSRVKGDTTITRNGEARIIATGHASCPIVENGSYRHGGHRGSVHGSKEVDGFVNLSDSKHSKRAVAGYGSHEKQVWVQKAGSG